MSPPRYTTFGPGELEERLRELSPGASFVSAASLRSGGNPGGGLLKRHRFPVTFPDGETGTCRYERCGPRYHLFAYDYSDGEPLPLQRYFDRLAGDCGAVEAKGRELAKACFRAAIEAECKGYFARASEPADGSRKRDPKKYRLKTDAAKAMAGKYALCRRLGDTLYAESPLFPSLEAANAAWRQEGDTRLVVACCNRLDRCWELPKYNPLSAEFASVPPKAEAEGGGGKTHPGENGERR